MRKPAGTYLDWASDSLSRQMVYLSEGDGERTAVTVIDPRTLVTADAFEIPKQSPDDFFLLETACGARTVYLYHAGEGMGRSLVCRDSGGGAAAGYPTLEDREGALIASEVARIYEETGISVYTGNDAVRYLYDYAAQVVTDEAVILDGIRSLTAFFDNCPPGFLRELCDRNSSIDICLSGTIIPEPGNRDAISDATAFVSEMDGIQVMVLDITQSGLTQTAAHEFLHIAENTMWKMQETDDTGSIDIFSRWEMLNPEGFAYHYVYTDEDGATIVGDEEYVYSDSSEERGIGDVYFVDGYSTTYPTEDRARIFENLAVYAPEERPEAFGAAGIRLKAAYLCACLRKAFPSVAAAEDVFWERGLDPAYTWDYFAENYDIDAWWASMEPMG